jgi:cephalosporin-C deacetylase
MKLVIFILAMSLMPTPRLAVADDIAAFWRTTLDQLAREPMDAKVEPSKEALPYQSFIVTLRSLGGVEVRGRLALPVQGEAAPKPWPAIITMPGYGGLQQGVMLSECQRGYAILQIFPRGQGDSADSYKIIGDKLTGQLDQPQGAYYQGAYADVIRAIDYAASRSDIDHDRIALVATSQGGGMALAVASLDPRVKAVVAHLPFLCNFPLAAKTPDSMVKRLLDHAARNDDAALHTLAYFDPYQLVPNLHSPALLSAGGKDQTCPIATIQSVFDRLHGDKTLKVYPDLTHTSCVDFYNLSWAWLDENFRHPKSSPAEAHL